MLVVVQHAGFVAKDYFTSGYDIESDYFVWNSIGFSWGRVGVILFFAISGFVIALQRTKSVGGFVTHRILRIFPIYWVAIAIAAVLLAMVGQRVTVSAPSILLYPSTISDGSSQIPYWTLAYETTFYALAAVFFALRLSDRTLTVIAVLWIVAVNIFWSEKIDYNFPGQWILLSAAVQVFPMGLICGIHFQKLKLAGRWPYLFAALVLFGCGIPLSELTPSKVLLHGLSASCLILAIADIDFRSRIVELLGNASYGIYLLHFPVMVFAAALFPDLGFFACFVIGMTTGTIFGLMDHRMYGWMVAGLQPALSKDLNQTR